MEGRESSRRSEGKSRGNGSDSARSKSQPQPQSQSSRVSNTAHRHNGPDNPRENDLLSHAASALRRLHFKSAGGSRSCRSVPKVVVMGSSTASEATINTSTDSANTMLTMVRLSNVDPRCEMLSERGNLVVGDDYGRRTSR